MNNGTGGKKKKRATERRCPSPSPPRPAAAGGPVPMWPTGPRPSQELFRNRRGWHRRRRRRRRSRREPDSNTVESFATVSRGRRRRRVSLGYVSSCSPGRGTVAITGVNGGVRAPAGVACPKGGREGRPVEEYFYKSSFSSLAVKFVSPNGLTWKTQFSVLDPE